MQQGTTEKLRLAELAAALSLATDLGMGQPMSHALRTCLLAVALGRAIGASERDLVDTYYTALLRYVGCTSDSHEFHRVAGNDVAFRQELAPVANGTTEEVLQHLTGFLARAGVDAGAALDLREALRSPSGLAARSMTAHCEVASMLAARLGLRASVCDALRHGFERWDGSGFPEGRSGEEVPLAVRLALMARDIEVLTRLRGLAEAREAVRQRRGGAYDPRVVDAFLSEGGGIAAALSVHDAWDEVLRREPGGPLLIAGSRLDDALTAFADFADVKTPFTLGHSRGVARLAEDAARSLGLPAGDLLRVRRAGLVHDLGRAGVSNEVWERPGPLGRDAWERVRLHPYYTERILACCAFLQPLGRLASSHHERLDGSGYHRGCRAAEIEPAARLLAAADACHAMLETRPYRPPLTLDQAARALRSEAAAGRLDPAAVEGVLSAAGAAARSTSRTWPGGLTDREIEVLRLMAQGLSNREMSAALGITPKTVGHHVQHIYDKLGFASRAAAAVFAVENGLLNG